MTSPRLISTIAACLLLALTIAALRADTAAAPPNRFGQLLQVGETVLLRPSTATPVYTVQLLSPAQAAEVQSNYDKYSILRKQRDGIDSKLETANDLTTRAALYIERKSLVTAIDDVAGLARLDTYAYKVAAVGEDYVTLQKAQKQKYIPLRSIREMVRSESLGARSYSSGRRANTLDISLRRETQIQLKYAQAAQVAKLINEFFPDLAPNLVVHEGTNLLQFTSDYRSTDMLQDFISILDVAVVSEQPTKGEPKP